MLLWLRNLVWCAFALCCFLDLFILVGYCCLFWLQALLLWFSCYVFVLWVANGLLYYYELLGLVGDLISVYVFGFLFVVTVWCCAAGLDVLFGCE